MNKFKKLAAAAASAVIAGTMAFSVTACGGKGSNGGDNGGKGDYTGADVYGILNDDGTINYGAYKRDGAVTLNLAVGYEKTVTSTSFRDLKSEITLPDGITYSDGNMKPAWEQMGKDLNITWKDVWDGSKTSANLEKLTTENQSNSSEKLYANTDLFTTDLSVAVSKANAGTDILNLADYLDYMPNFRQFLNENPVVYLSLLQDGMNTSTGDKQMIYVAPYFDGYDDIERYCLIRHDWVEKLLNGDGAGSDAKFSAECAATTFATSFMGSEPYEIETLTADGSSTQIIKKDYAAARTAAADVSKPLGEAYNAIAGTAYSGESGNIVDVMNAAIAANKNATGAQLIALYRAYIDVCYTKDGSAYFGSSNRANLFTGYDACWDVDDLVAMLRCVKTNASVLVESGHYLGGIAPRTGQNDRTPDLVSLAGQLYGVRGTTSRNEFTYIDNDGNVQDARTKTEFYEAMANMNSLLKEGLIADYSGLANFTNSSGLSTSPDYKGEYFMMYDYSQTQTLAGFVAEDSSVTYKDFPNGTPQGYFFAPVISPVSKWDVDEDGEIAADEYFRFTESWRSTKTSGLAVNGAIKSNEAKLKAALQFIDYLYSEDGRIVSTYGPMANNADGEGGFWYNTAATDAEISSGSYFTYKGVKYSGTDYKGKTTPTITDKVYNSFKGQSVNGWKISSNTAVAGAQLSFTSYARYLVGSTLPAGVKDQSFENQLTSQMGQTGAGVVGVALAKGVIRGMSLDIDKNNYWFTCVPTGLPVSSSNQELLDSTAQMPFKYLTGTQISTGDKNFFSIMNYIILNGTAATYNQQGVVVSYTSIENLLESKLGGDSSIMQLAVAREYAWYEGWNTAKKYWTYLSSAARN